MDNQKEREPTVAVMPEMVATSFFISWLQLHAMVARSMRNKENSIIPNNWKSSRPGPAAWVAFCAAYFLVIQSVSIASEPKALRKDHEGPLILAHYMAWFAAKPVSPDWGWHWTMNTFDPEKKQESKRRVASHYYPLIGPYDSSDPAVLEYHLLLMKLSGIDGVVVDWYGTSDDLDFAMIHRNTSALFLAASKLEMKFAVCFEDQTIGKLVAHQKLPVADRVKRAREEMAWLKKNWFADPAYVRIEGMPLLLSFGSSGLTDREWEEVFPATEMNPVYLSEHQRRSASRGTFDWPVPKEFPASLDRFYKAATKASGVNMPVAFPRFHDIYREAKVHESWGSIPDDNGRTWETTLTRALTSDAPLVQLATWNDWGEGTMIEPSEEFGYRDLELLQRLRRDLIDREFTSKPNDLRFPYRLYRLRQTQPASSQRKADLDKLAQLIAKGSLIDAQAELARLEANDR